MIVMPSTYSPATIAREFKVIHEFELSSMKYGVIFDKNVPKAAIIRMNTESFNGIPRHRIIAALDLVAKQELGENVFLFSAFGKILLFFKWKEWWLNRGRVAKGWLHYFMKN